MSEGEALQYTLTIEDCMMEITMLLNEKFGSAYPNELSRNQQLVLILIDKHKSLTMRDIANKINVSVSAVSQMIAKMDQMKFVTRIVNPSDRRIIHIRLAKKGKDVIQKMGETRQEIFTKYLSQMNVKDLRLLSEKINKFRDIIRMEGEKEIR